MQIGKIHARDIIAVITIVGGMILISFGVNHIIGGILTMIAAFYFGMNIPKPKDD